MKVELYAYKEYVAFPGPKVTITIDGDPTAVERLLAALKEVIEKDAAVFQGWRII